MRAERQHEAARIASKVAGHARRVCWWADYEDLHQQVWLAVVESERTFDEEVGIPFEHYAARAAHFAVTRYLWGQSAPVSGSSLRGLVRAGPAARVPCGYRDDDEHIDTARWAERVRDATEEALSSLGAERARRALRVIDGDKSAVVAAEHRVPVQQVYREAREARELLAGSSELWRLWRER